MTSVIEEIAGSAGEKLGLTPKKKTKRSKLKWGVGIGLLSSIGYAIYRYLNDL